MTQPSGNVYRMPRRFNWLIVATGFAFLSLLLMAWRWGAVDGNALGYFETGLWLRDEIPHADLHAPFAYRLAVPALAAFIPGELHHVFAFVNWVFVTVGACLATATARRLGFGTPRALAAGLLVILSLPTLWYAPQLLPDAGAMCLRMLFVFAVLTGNTRVALGAALVATAVSEENILLLGWLLGTDRIERRQGAWALAGAVAWLALVRLWIAPGLPGLAWLPNLDAVVSFVTDWRGLLALIGCAGLVVPLALAGLRDAPPRIAPLKGLLVWMAVPVALAPLCMRVEGCIVWGLYPFLLPFAVAYGLPRAAEARPQERQLRLVRRA